MAASFTPDTMMTYSSYTQTGKPNNFLTDLNTIHDPMKSYHEKPTQSITFLDT